MAPREAGQRARGALGWCGQEAGDWMWAPEGERPGQQAWWSGAGTRGEEASQAAG